LAIPSVICPAECGGEAAWAGEVEVIAAPSLLAIVNHFKGTQLLPPPEPRLAPSRSARLDLAGVKGQPAMEPMAGCAALHPPYEFRPRAPQSRSLRSTLRSARWERWSGRLAHRQPKAREIKLAMLWIAEGEWIIHHYLRRDHT
jgi:hypothetical protein